ncbi:MAG: leucine-rich repeat domain-containing protein [Erysipelotrichaceae bacterium]|nr:leucine-rich repeat domain-containing protein [Erysipelotrichaceae bacterium]
MSFTIEKNKLVSYVGDDEVVILPEEVEILGEFAFSNAKCMRSIILHDHLQEIGTSAFYNCENLLEIELPDSVYYMDTAVFSRCIHLKSVKLSKKLSAVPKITFYQCFDLEEVNLPERVTRLNRAAFEQCRSLKNLEIPETLRMIEDNVFDSCGALKELVLPEGMKSIGENAFYECSSLRFINLPSTLEKIGKGALETRGKLTVIGSSKVLIKPEIFDNNWNMNWNFGSNHRYNGKNEENYNLINSYLPNVNLKMWKPEAQCVLCVNYLETRKRGIDFFDEWIKGHKDVFMEMVVSKKRFEALNKALELELIVDRDVEPYLNRISNRDERAKLLNRKATSSIDDLFDML